MSIYALLFLLVVFVSCPFPHAGIEVSGSSSLFLARAVGSYMGHASAPRPSLGALYSCYAQLTDNEIHNVSSSSSSSSHCSHCSHCSLRGTKSVSPAAGIGQAVVICGPSGVGKGTLIKKLLSLYPDVLGLSVSHTSRPPREGEINGSDYHFVSRGAIEKILRENGSYFIETAEVHGNLYGTSLDAIRRIQADGKVCVLDVDTKGVLHFKQQRSFPAKYIFLASPTKKVLEKRLRGRGTESEQEVRIRLANAEDQMSFGLTSEHFDAVVVNADLDTTVNKIKQLMNHWFNTTL